MKKITTEDFISKAKAVHGDKYEYSQVAYTGSHNKVEILCPVHGKFMQDASYHLSGNGCVRC